MHSPIIDGKDAGLALLRRLPPRELQLAGIVHHLGEASAVEIETALPDCVSNAAIRSMLRRLEAKGVIIRYRHGRKFLYAPAALDEPSEAALRRIARDHFAGSLARAVAAMSGLLAADFAQLQR
jgi:predicted transcriptional regulator